MLRLKGVGVTAAAAREWILVTAAAAAGGHRLALLQAGGAAATHSGSDIGSAIVNRACRRWRRHRHESKRQQRRSGRGGNFQDMFHLLSLSWFWNWFTPAAQMGCRDRSRHRHKKEVKDFLSGQSF